MIAHGCRCIGWGMDQSLRSAHVSQPVCAGFFAAAAVVWFHDIVCTQCVVVIVVLAVVYIVLITFSICLATTAEPANLACCKYSKPAAITMKRSPPGSASTVLQRCCQSSGRRKCSGFPTMADGLAPQPAPVPAEQRG